MVFLMETKIDKKRVEKVRRNFGFLNRIDIEVEGSRGGLSLAWKGEITVQLRSFSKSHIDVMITEENGQEDWRFTRFYGSPYLNNKTISWNLLRKLGEEQNHPWLVCGESNEILYSFEKKKRSTSEAEKNGGFLCGSKRLSSNGHWIL